MGNKSRKVGESIVNYSTSRRVAGRPALFVKLKPYESETATAESSIFRAFTQRKSFFKSRCDLFVSRRIVEIEFAWTP